MKAKLEQLNVQSEKQSFICYRVNRPGFEFTWHYHPEYELTFIEKGKGKRLVGDSFANFDDHDFVLIGPLVPHTWATEPYVQPGCSAIVIQFSAAFIEPFFQYRELNGIENILQKSEKGLWFNALENKEIVDKLRNIMECTEAEKLTTLIQVLHLLSSIKAVVLSSNQFKPLKGKEDQQRINKVFNYIQQEFSRKISLQTAASFVYLSDSAFCKFFKRVTGKTFSDYVNDIRISKAVELLLETDKGIEQIAFETGFESQTYFNRIFLRKKGKKPGELRRLN